MFAFLREFALLLAIGVVAGADIVPQEPIKDFWVNNGAVRSLPIIDEQGNLAIQQTKFYVATSSLHNQHAVSKAGLPIPHVHFQHEYDVDGGNRYWDQKFDAPRMSRRIGDATIKSNGSSRLLEQFEAGGSFDCWIDENGDGINLALKSEVGIASLSSILQSAEQGKEASQSEHSSKRSTATQTPLKEITWKTGCSGVYRASVDAFKSKSIVRMQVE